MLDGANDTGGNLLGCKLGTPVAVGIILGWPDGAAGTDGFPDGINDGWAETLGDSDGNDDGTTVSVGLILGWLDGWPDTD